jgi:hypothetical protein
MMRMLVFVLAALGLLASTAGADEYWIAYEGNDFPENAGWTRVYGNEHGYGQGGAERWIDNGVFVVDSRRHPLIFDFYQIERDLDPLPGEVFVMRWRMRVLELTGNYDSSVGMFSNNFMALGFAFTEDSIFSVFEDDVGAPLAQGQFHDFEVVSRDMLTYELCIDGAPGFAGEFWESVDRRRVGWGDGVQGAASLTEWDYFEFGVVAEPKTVWIVAFTIGVVCRRGGQEQSPRSASY